MFQFYSGLLRKFDLESLALQTLKTAFNDKDLLASAWKSLNPSKTDLCCCLCLPLWYGMAVNYK